MSQAAQYAMERAPSQVAALTIARVQVLAERGRMDMLCLEEAGEWLRRGMALHTLAFEDAGWKAVVEARDQAQRRNAQQARFRMVIEFLRLTTEGGDAETTSAFLGMNEQDRETASTLSTQWPDTASSMIRALEREREREQLDTERHEERLKRAFLCFQTGYSLDPYNREINFILAEYYSVGLGVARDEERSMAFLRRSAELGHTGAQRALSYRYSAELRNGAEREISWFARNGSGGGRAGHRSMGAASPF